MTRQTVQTTPGMATSTADVPRIRFVTWVDVDSEEGTGYNIFAAPVMMTDAEVAQFNALVERYADDGKALKLAGVSVTDGPQTPITFAAMVERFQADIRQPNDEA